MMHCFPLRRSVSLIALILSLPLAAQTVPPAIEPPLTDPSGPAAPETNDEEAEIIVTGQRPRGAVVGNIPAEVSYSGRELRALGVSSVTELLGTLAPQIASGQGRGGSGGRPVVLINGLRTTGFAEVRDIPSEAISRIEIFPEELALRYGYRAEQKVVNIVLRRRFRAITTELGPSLATDGGRAGGKADVTLLRIDEQGRLNLNAQFQHLSALTESEREIPLSADNALDERAFRTLLAETNTVSLNGIYNRKLSDRLALTVNLRGESSESDGAIGAFLPAETTSPLGLERQGISREGQASLMLAGNSPVATWSLTGAYAATHAKTHTDRANDPAESTRSTGQTASLQAVGSGSLVALPAGDVALTLQAGGELQDISSASSRLGVTRSAMLERSVLSGQASVDVPIASARRDVLAPLGTLNLNLNAGLERLSDFDTLVRYGAGLSWTPASFINLVASYNREEGAPSLPQLGNPFDAVPNVRIFDFTRQENITVTQITGGNPDLRADDRRVWKLSATVRPFADPGISFSANYINTRTYNLISAFPAATPAIEAAFPDRFVRDEDGRLLSLDSRPVNFARAREEQLRWGVNVSKTVGKGRAPTEQERSAFRAMMTRNQAQAGADRAGRAGVQGDGERRGGGQGGPPLIGQTRMQFSLYHSWFFRDDLLPAIGSAPIDLLDGGAVDAQGGQARHLIDARLGATRNGIGARVEASWRSATRVASGSSETLRFAPQTIINLRLFATPGQHLALVAKAPWLRGTRLTLAVDNVFNSRPQVSSANGLTPISYSPDYLEPAGRTIRLTFRKLFF